MNDNWSKEELKASIESYLEMHQKVRNGEKIIKKRYYEALHEAYGRSIKAYEYRMQNISFVLSIQGRQWLTGLKPASHVGSNVVEEIESILADLEGRRPNPNLEFEAKVKNELEKKILEKPTGNKNPKTREDKSTSHIRDPKVKAWVLKESKGICEYCNKEAPFLTFEGNPFLEVHHVIRLADGGNDTIDNATALCPNCHREFHYGRNRVNLVSSIKEKVIRLNKNRDLD